MHILGLALVLAMGVGQQDVHKCPTGIVTGADLPCSFTEPTMQPIGPLCTPESFQCPEDKLYKWALGVNGVKVEQVVPAVQVTEKHKDGTAECSYSNPKSNFVTCTDHYYEEMHWSCADKSRVLLTSEDGQHHWCVRF